MTPLFSDVADALSIKWFFIDTNMTVRYVSEAYLERYKVSAEAVEDCSIASFTGLDTAEKLESYCVRALSGENSTFEGRLSLTPGLGAVDVRLNFIPHLSSDENPGFYILVSELTEDRLAIAALGKLHSIVDNSHSELSEKIQQLLMLGVETFNLPIALLSHIDGDQYRVKYAVTPNNEVKPGDQFELGNTYCIHTLQANGPLGFDHVGNSAISSHPCYKNFALEAYLGIPLIVDGERYGTLNFSSPEIRPTKFSVNDYELIRLFSQWIGNELTRDKHQNKFLRQQALFESMSEQARIGAWELDLTTNELYWSDMTRIIHEVPVDFVPSIETGINFYKEGSNRDRISRCVTQALEEGKPWSEEFQLVTAKGHEIWVAALGKAEFVNGECTCLYGSFQDVDEQVKSRIALLEAKEKAEEAAKVKGEFLANMSHEIRTPMNGVLGVLDVLNSSGLNDEQSNLLAIAQSSSESLLSLINEILDFSKIEAGKLSFEHIDFDLLSMLHSFAESIQFMAEEKNLTFDLDVSNINHGLINSDPSRIRQILNNLVSNALKFTTQGGISVKASLCEQDGVLVFSCDVLDTGIGIPAHQLTDLFNPFTQADSSTTRKFGGTGLGLAIVKNICNLMGGDVHVHSQENVGSRFSFNVNVSRPVSSHSVSENASSIPGYKRENQATNTAFDSNTRILLVEDNQINQLVANEILKNMGLEAEIAVNGVEAITMLQQSDLRYDIILMDCQMPEMDGYEASRQIRKGSAGAHYKYIPIVALTANAMKGDRETCLRAGMNAYVSKPVQANELRTAIAELLA